MCSVFGKLMLYSKCLMPNHLCFIYEIILENYTWYIRCFSFRIKIKYKNYLCRSMHYENLPMQYTEIFSVVKIENFIRKMLIFFLFLLKT